MPRFLLLALNLALLILGASLYWHQRQATTALRTAVAAPLDEPPQLLALHRENEALRQSLLNSSDLAALRADHEALPILRAELQALQASAEKRLQNAAQANPPRSEPPTFTATDWINAGRRTPIETVVTALWASTRGEKAVLADLIHLDARTEERLRPLLAALPEAEQRQFTSLEAFAADITTRSLRVDSIQFLELDASLPEDAPFTTLRVRVTSPGGSERYPTLVAVRSASGWKLLLPAPVVDRYTQTL
jgi:hypothetical protein